MIQKLQNIKTSDLEELKRDVNNGGKFVLFNYRIGLGVISLLRFSPAFFIKREHEIELFQKKYNIINLVFGPWVLLQGPFLTYDAYKVNKKGGINITKDIMINLTQESLLKNEVEIKIIDEILEKVKSSDKKNILKAIRNTNCTLVPLKKVYVGLYVNVEDYEEPYFVIGIQLQNDDDLNIKHIEMNLRKYYYKHVVFDIFDIEDIPEYGEKLIEQGELIYNV